MDGDPTHKEHKRLDNLRIIQKRFLIPYFFPKATSGKDIPNIGHRKFIFSIPRHSRHFLSGIHLVYLG
jgi:hypothetical protein